MMKGARALAHDQGAAGTRNIVEDEQPFTSASTVYEAGGERLARARDSAGKPCLVRILGNGAATLREELRLAPQLSPAWAVVPRHIVHVGGVPHLVLDDAAGVPLASLLGEPFAPERLLRIAVSAAGALASFHATGLVHGDLTPAHMLCEPETAVVRLMGFGGAYRPTEDARAEPSAVPFTGAFTHMAPEQTGRLNRSVDQRADLYALGVTLFQMATGVLPCTGKDPMSWIHCHVAVQPLAPTALAPGLPEPVGAIILKLLAKMPEERYRTAAGVQADLARCLLELQREGRVAPFAVGSQDVSATFRLPAKLYGRDGHRLALIAQYERVRTENHAGLVLVSGGAGTGKTSLVRELLAPVVRDRGLFAEGKFEAVAKRRPFSPIASIVEALIRQVLALDERRQSEIRRRAAEAVGDLGGLLVERFPAVEHMLGRQRPAPPLPPPEARSLFLDVLQRFLTAFAEPAHPAVIFLDDLQWADADEIALLTMVNRQAGPTGVLWVGGYRDAELGPDHPLRAALPDGAAWTLALADLAEPDIAALVADALSVSAAQAAPLAQALYGRSGGNPLAARQLLTSLVDDGLIAFDLATRRWSWGAEALTTLETAGGFEALIAGKVARLAPASRRVAELAAVVGSAGDTVALSAMAGRSPDVVAGALQAAAALGLLSRQGDGYRFVHDRVRQAIYAPIPQAERATFHRAMAHHALRNAPLEAAADDLVFDSATHLNLADAGSDAAAVGDVTAERRLAADLNAEAGRRAIGAGAFQAAWRYFEAGLAALPQTAWESDHATAFGLHLGGARAAWLTGRLERAQALLASVAGHALALTERLAVETLRVQVSTIRGDMVGAVDAGLAGLVAAGIHLSPHPDDETVAAAVACVWQHLGDRPIEALLALPPLEDPLELGILELMAAMSAPVLFVDRNLYTVLHAEMTCRTIEKGLCGPTALAFVVFGMIIGSALGRFAEGERFGAVALAIAGQEAHLASRAVVFMTYGSMVGPWTRPLEACVPLVETGLEAAVRTGDLTRACYCHVQIAAMRFAGGEPLEGLAREVAESLAFVRRARFEAMAGALDDLTKAIELLRREDAAPRIEDVGPPTPGPTAAELPPIVVARGWTLRLQLQGWFGTFEAAEATAALVAPMLDASFAQIDVPTYHLFAGLAHAALGRPGDRAALARCLQALEPLAAASPANFGAARALLAAESLRLDQQPLAAMLAYDDAIRIALDAGLLPIAGLAQERAAAFYAAEGLAANAASYAAAAHAQYGRWGARAKLRELEARFPTLRDTPAQAAGRPDLAGVDAVAVARASSVIARAIRQDEAAEAILRVMVERAGARRGALVRQRDGERRVVALATLEGERIAVDLAPGPTAAPLPWTLIAHVARTHLPVMLDDATRGAFAGDPYVVRLGPRSVLCLPLLRQAGPAGYVYLENDLTAGAFSAADLEVLQLLGAQAAITLENADLYEAVMQREAQLARANEALEARIAERTIDLAAVNDALRRREAMLAEAQQLAALGSWEWDVARNRVVWSDELYRIFGVEPAAFSSTYEAYLALVHPDDQARVRGEIEGALRELRPMAFEHRIIRPDGAIRDVASTGKVLMDPAGHPARMVGTAQDITARKALEAQLVAQNARLRELDQLKTNFVNSVSHELRTPLTTIRGYAEFLEDQIGGPLEPAQQAFVAHIQAAAQRLERLVDDLLDYARIEAGTFTLQIAEGDLAARVREIAESFRPQAADAHVTLVTDLPAEPVPVQLDLPRIGQVITNLISNAIKFSPPDRTVRVTLRPDPTELLVEVADEGSGIAPEEMSRLFQRFSQLEAGRRKQRGTGLGLSISKALVEAHGGRIGVHSEPGAGTTFWFRVPRVAQP